jgi:hypothetical protein
MNTYLRQNWLMLFAALVVLLLCVTGHMPHGALGAIPLIGLSTTAFPVNPTLTAIAIGWRNPDVALIADTVMPRFPVNGKKFSYTLYNAQQGFTVPDTKVGRKSEPTMVDFSGSLVPSEVVDYGLDDLVPNDEVQAWQDSPKPPSGGPLSPLDLSTMMLTSLVELDREIRVAGAVFNGSNYSAANQVVLSGSSQWNDPTCNPLDALLAALDTTLVRANQLTLGQAAWTKLRQHPKVVQAIYKTVQGAGTVTRQALADLLEIERVIVGTGFVNIARKGQAPNYVRVWGKHAALTFTSLSAAQTGQPCWGFTAQWGTRIAGEMPEPKAGLRGGVRVRMGESVQEVISAPDAGYLFQNVVA